MIRRDEWSRVARTGPLYLLLCLLMTLTGCGGGGSEAPISPPNLTSHSNGSFLTPGVDVDLVVQVKASRANETILFIAPPEGAGLVFENPAPEGSNYCRATAGADGRATVRARSNGVEGPVLVSALIESTGVHTTIALTNVVTKPTPALNAETVRAAAEQRFTAEGLNGPFLLPAGSEIKGYDATTAVAQESWFFWVDTKPDARFSHPTKFITLPTSDAGAGFMDRALVVDHDWYPSVSTAGREAEPLLSGFLLSPPRSVEIAKPAAQSRAPDDACAIVIRGPYCGGAAQDCARFAGWLVGAGRVNPGNVQMPDHPVTFAELKELIAKAKRDGCKKVYLYIASHGRPYQIRLAPIKGGPKDSDVVSYEDIAKELAGIDEVLAAVDACDSGTAIEAFRNHGFDGEVATATDATSTSNMDPEDNMTGQWTYQFLECAQMLGTNPPDPNRPTWKEIVDCIKQRGNAEVMQGNPSYGVVGDTDAVTTEIPKVGILKDGDTRTITINRPPFGSVSRTLNARLTIENGQIATFDNDSTTKDIVFGPNVQQIQVTLRGVADGHTFYSLSAVNFEGTRIEGGPAAVDVGSHYQFSPQVLEMTVNEQREIALNRFGVLTSHGYTTSVNLNPGDTAIARPLVSSLEFGDGTLLRLLNIKAGFKNGETTIVATDPVHGLSTTLTIKVHQQVTLMNALVAPDGTRFEAGAVISTARITGYHVARPDVGCEFWHLHSMGAGIFIDGKGPLADPNPGACGYGHVIQPE